MVPNLKIQFKTAKANNIKEMHQDSHYIIQTAVRERDWIMSILTSRKDEIILQRHID